MAREDAHEIKCFASIVASKYGLYGDVFDRLETTRPSNNNVPSSARAVTPNPNRFKPSNMAK